MYLYVKLNWYANCFFQAESKDCMDSASYEYRNTGMSGRIGTQFGPVSIPLVLENVSPKDHENVVD